MLMSSSLHDGQSAVSPLIHCDLLTGPSEGQMFTDRGQSAEQLSPHRAACKSACYSVS